MIATHLLYTAAGSPTVPHAEPAQSTCWWCCSGLDTVAARPITDPALGVPLSTMPDTFLDACGRQAGAPSSTHLCLACAWTLSDAVRLPVRVGAALLAKALYGDQEGRGRLSVAVGDEAPSRRLVLALPSGQVGVWERPGKAADEARWHVVRPDLLDHPADVGPARYLGAYDPHVLARAVGGKFRNFVPFADADGRWEMFTKANRAEIVQILLNPPSRPWALAIGDGQKHVAIYTRVNPGSTPAQVVYFEGSQVHYKPSVLNDLLTAVKGLLYMGVRREAIEQGRYTLSQQGHPVGIRHERSIRPFRGGPLLGLALWLAVKDEQAESGERT